MIRSARRLLVPLFSIVSLAAMPTPLSDPVGVYALVDRVVLEPNAQAPTAIQVWGTFAVSDQKPGDSYLAPEKGYLYYAINTSGERASRAEWSDLQAIAGTKALVGFGQKWSRVPLGRVRCATEKPANPDVYPLGLGVLKTGAERNTAWEPHRSMVNGSATNAKCK